MNVIKSIPLFLVFPVLSFIFFLSETADNWCGHKLQTRTIWKNLLPCFSSYTLKRYHLSMWELSFSLFSEVRGKTLECSSFALSLVFPPKLSFSHVSYLFPEKRTVFFFFFLFLLDWFINMTPCGRVVYFSWKSDCWKC